MIIGAHHIALEMPEQLAFQVVLKYTYVSPVDPTVRRNMLVAVQDGFITRDAAWREAERLNKLPLTKGVVGEYE